MGSIGYCVEIDEERATPRMYESLTEAYSDITNALDTLRLEVDDRLGEQYRNYLMDVSSGADIGATFDVSLYRFCFNQDEVLEFLERLEDLGPEWFFGRSRISLETDVNGAEFQFVMLNDAESTIQNFKHRFFSLKL